MIRRRGSVAVRLAIGYGCLTIGTVTAVVVLVYVGTVGVLERSIDANLHIVSDTLSTRFDTGGATELQNKIETLLNDHLDQDTEVYLLHKPDGQIIGNASGVRGVPLGLVTNRTILRYGQRSYSRLLSRRLPDGYVLIVGRDLADLTAIRQLFLRAISAGIAIALLLAGTWSLIFFRQLEARIAAIRRTAEEIEGGHLSRRIPEDSGSDEFSKLNHSLNRMLDRIQRLMDGVRDVSNAIAHDLRTPLGRIRSLLDDALLSPEPEKILAERARMAIGEIDEITAVFDKLLQIAEAESGGRTQDFHRVSLNDVVMNVVELYDATAEQSGIALIGDVGESAIADGDKDLLASATANLVDNAIKYAGEGATVRVRSSRTANTASITVMDNGPGVPEPERSKIVTRFYRMDRSRSAPGNGLGLAIVEAISHLHGGSLLLEDADPGLIARIVLPRFDGSGAGSDYFGGARENSSRAATLAGDGRPIKAQSFPARST